MAVCSVIRSVSHTELFLFRGVVHAGVPDRLGERESYSEWYHARAVELRSPPRDPSFKLYSARSGEGGGEASERPSAVRVSRSSSMNGRESPYVCISSVYVSRRLAERRAPLTF